MVRITNGKASGFVSDVNLAEFYYKTGQKLGEDTAEARFGLLANSRIGFVPTDREMARQPRSGRSGGPTYLLRTVSPLRLSRGAQRYC